MKITGLKTNHLTNPLGYQIDEPVFSYIVEESVGSRQTEARICVYRDEEAGEVLYDSGFQENISSVAVPVKLTLEPMMRYYWQVTVRTDAGEEETSQMQWFETGKQDAPWVGKWIGCDSDTQRHPIFFRQISPEKKVVRARLYLSGLGVYKAFYNGVQIGDEWLAPYCNNYKSWVQYQTYDVTEQLQEAGELSVALGKGWYLSRFGFTSSVGSEPVYGDRFRLIGEVHLWYEDGTDQVVGTDESWQVRYGTVTESSIYDGEHRDDTLPLMPTEQAVILEDIPAKLTARYSVPVRVKQELKPVALLHTPAGEQVFDLGQNMAGSFRFHVHEPYGTKIHLQVGEVLQKDCFYRDNLRSALAEYWYVSDGKPHELTADFVFYGYRYVKVEGVSHLSTDDFTGLVLYSDLPEAGRLVTGHAKINRLIQNAEWGLRGNFIDVPTDCPQRDERMGWTGDAQVFSPTATFLHDTYAFFRKYLHDCDTEQQMRDGLVPDVIPAFDQEGTSCVWGDAACIIPWNLYLYYGDIRILEEQYESMKAWVEYIRKTDGENHHWREVFHFGDWLALDHPSGRKDAQLGGTDEGFIADVYYRYSAQILSKAAAVLGKTADAEKYRALADQILLGIKEEFFSPEGRCCISTQTGAILTLQHGLSHCPDRAEKELLRLLKARGNKLATGFVGTPFLCSILTETGHRELAYEILLNEEYPGWLYEVNMGATTVWERWNSVEPDGSISSTGMNSLNHYAYGSIVEWLWRYGVGLNPLEEAPGFRKTRIQPQPSGKMKYMEGEYHSSAGVWKVSWQAEDLRHLTVSVTVPFGCEGELILPFVQEGLEKEQPDNPIFACKTEAGYCLRPGSYQVTYETSAPLDTRLTLQNTLGELFENPKMKQMLKETFQGIDLISEEDQNIPMEQLICKLRPENGKEFLKLVKNKLDEINS